MFGMTPSRRGRLQHNRLGADPGTLAQLRDQFDSMFEQMLGRVPAPIQDLAYARLWDFDVADEENEVVVRAEMPGFEPSDIDVQVHDSTLTIDAEKCEQGAQEESFRNFHRTVALPAPVAAERARAKYRNGVLELRLPKTEEARAKRIPVHHEPEHTIPAPAPHQPKK